MNSSRKLVTIPFSHFCEKVRWGLDRAGLAYREEAHLPLFHWPAAWLAGRSRTVPILVDGEAVLTDSTDILHHINRLRPEAGLFSADPEIRAEQERWETLFDERLGTQTRRVIYFHLLQDKPLTAKVFRTAATGWEKGIVGTAAPLLGKVISKGLNVNRDSADRSRARVFEIFDSVAGQLERGHKHLCGDVLSAADITFAALAGPVVLPPQYGFRFPDVTELSDKGREEIDRMRAHPAGRYALELYRDHRTHVAPGISSES